MAPIHLLQDDLLKLVFSFCPAPQIQRSNWRVCKRFKKVSQEVLQARIHTWMGQLVDRCLPRVPPATQPTLVALKITLETPSSAPEWQTHIQTVEAIITSVPKEWEFTNEMIEIYSRVFELSTPRAANALMQMVDRVRISLISDKVYVQALETCFKHRQFRAAAQLAEKSEKLKLVVLKRYFSTAEDQRAFCHITIDEIAALAERLQDAKWKRQYFAACLYVYLKNGSFDRACGILQKLHPNAASVLTTLLQEHQLEWNTAYFFALCLPSPYRESCLLACARNVYPVVPFNISQIECIESITEEAEKESCMNEYVHYFDEAIVEGQINAAELATIRSPLLYRCSKELKERLGSNEREILERMSLKRKTPQA